MNKDKKLVTLEMDPERPKRVRLPYRTRGPAFVMEAGMVLMKHDSQIVRELRSLTINLRTRELQEAPLAELCEHLEFFKISMPTVIRIQGKTNKLRVPVLPQILMALVLMKFPYIDLRLSDTEWLILHDQLGILPSAAELNSRSVKVDENLNPIRT